MDLKCLSEPINELAQYIKKHFFLSFALAAVVALIYGKQAFSTDFYIDAEVILNNAHTVYNWDSIGRFGLVALKYLIGNNWYNPYFEAALYLAALWLLGMSTVCLFSVLNRQLGDGISFIFVSLFLFFPTYADQFMFRFQSFEVVFAMFLAVFATRYFYLFIKKKNYSAYILAVFLAVFAFGIYQSMVNLLICLYIAVYLFSVSESSKTERKRLVKNEILHFCVSFIVYELIVQLFFSSGSYLSSQIGWFSGDVRSVILNLLAYIKRILFALDVFYPITYLSCVLCSILFLVWTFIYNRKKFVPYLIGIGGLLASLFFLAIGMGTPSPYRAQCMLPFVCAVIWLFMALWLKERGVYRYIVCILLGVIFMCCQSAVLMRLFYTQDIIRDADKTIAVQMMTRISDMDTQDGGKPVVFLGHMDAKTNASCYTKREAASYLSYSVYEFAYIEGVPVDTPDYFNSLRILGYFETMGFDYAAPSVELVEAAKAEGTAMESWPAADSVRETADCVIVKLSD
ncbi:MAG: hypothetical protein HDR19_05125 [Lachnospiraceae bacterium]|nr:hypothetical protein [Lachnospiraceae bacterium]